MFAALWAKWFFKAFSEQPEKDHNTPLHMSKTTGTALAALWRWCFAVRSATGEKVYEQFSKWAQLTVCFIIVIFSLDVCSPLSFILTSYLFKSDWLHSKPLSQSVSHRMERSACLVDKMTTETVSWPANQSGRKGWSDSAAQNPFLWIPCTCLLPWQCSPRFKY